MSRFRKPTFSAPFLKKPVFERPVFFGGESGSGPPDPEFFMAPEFLISTTPFLSNIFQNISGNNFYNDFIF